MTESSFERRKDLACFFALLGGALAGVGIAFLLSNFDFNLAIWLGVMGGIATALVSDVAFDAKRRQKEAPSSGPTKQVDEIVAVLRRAVRGEIAVQLVGDTTWDDVQSGDVEFLLGDVRCEFFNDCDSLDYLNHVVFHDGRTASFEDWVTQDSENNPIDHLTGIEYAKLVSLLKSAEVQSTV